jgi:hypothetical protein
VAVIEARFDEPAKMLTVDIDFERSASHYRRCGAAARSHPRTRLRRSVVWRRGHAAQLR